MYTKAFPRSTQELFGHEGNLAHIIDTRIGGLVPTVMLSEPELRSIPGIGNRWSHLIAERLDTYGRPLRRLTDSRTTHMENHFGHADHANIALLHVTKQGSLLTSQPLPIVTILQERLPGLTLRGLVKMGTLGVIDELADSWPPVHGLLRQAVTGLVERHRLWPVQNPLMESGTRHLYAVS